MIKSMLLQVLVLESIEDTKRRLCVCTTHLYFHPLGSVVRLLQSAVAIRHLEHIKSIQESKVCEYVCLLILCLVYEHHKYRRTYVFA